MALDKLPCGDWVNLPADALAGPQQFKRWYREHHLPFCRQNPKRIKIETHVAEQRGPQRITVVQFTEQLNHPQLEIIPERIGATWRVLNRRTQSWPVVHIGDWLDISDPQDVKVISLQVFQEQYFVDEKPVVTTEPKGAPVDDDAGEAASTPGAGSTS